MLTVLIMSVTMVNALIMMVIQSRLCPDVTSIDHVSNDGECTDNDGCTE